MEPGAYRRLTAELESRLAADTRVVGLVALGSMAERDYGPDEWSDHDFFVVTTPGAQEELRGESAWLPRADEIVLRFRETAHGLKVIYGDGHLLEYAVFDLDELGVASVNRYRVLFDRGGVAERLAALAGPRPRRDPSFHFGVLVSNVLVGAGRWFRGERLSGTFFVKSLAVRAFLELVTESVPAPRADLLDDLDPLRRFEAVHPQLAAELESVTRAETPEAALGLLALTERELEPLRPDLEWRALAAVRERLLRAAP